MFYQKMHRTQLIYDIKRRIYYRIGSIDDILLFIKNTQKEHTKNTKKEKGTNLCSLYLRDLCTFVSLCEIYGGLYCLYPPFLLQYSHDSR